MLNADDARLRSMFEREYHTLVALRHPRIIEAYEYGVDAGRPYYTMELLDGQDLREFKHVPYRTACRYLRDIASSLALLHSRRLLHRDVSPRNVRVTSDVGAFRSEKRAAHELIRLLGPLAIAGYRVDRRLAIQYGDEAVEVLRSLIGLRTAERLRPYGALVPWRGKPSADRAM